MTGINTIKIKSLKQTKAFYIWELKRSESLTEKQRDSYTLALKSIEKIIKEKKNPGKERRSKRSTSDNFLPGEKEKAKYFSERGY